jgi:NADH:ubiquinone oxidoreductase subunit 6 (subunit J)
LIVVVIVVVVAIVVVIFVVVVLGEKKRKKRNPKFTSKRIEEQLFTRFIVPFKTYNGLCTMVLVRRAQKSIP